MAKFEFENIDFSQLYEVSCEFWDIQKKVYSSKYAKNSKVKLGFHVEGSPKILKGLYSACIENSWVCMHVISSKGH